MTTGNKVRMIGPKGKISKVSRKAARSGHLAKIGFRPLDDVIPAVPSSTSKTKAASDADQA